MLRAAQSGIRRSWNQRSIVIDAQPYTPTSIPPPPSRRPNRTAEEQESLRQALGNVAFLTSHEYQLLSSPRSNVARELASQQQHRLEVREGLIKKLESIVKNSTSEIDAFSKIDAEADSASLHLETKIDDDLKVRQFADWNYIYIVPDSHREIIRHNDIIDLPAETQAEFYRLKEDWYPTEYKSIMGTDIQLAAAFSPTLRKRLLDEVERIGKQATEAATTPEEKKLIAAEISNSLDAVDPTRDITEAAIKAASDLEVLKSFADRVHAYNGDERLLQIFSRAAEIKGADQSQFLSLLRTTLYAK